MHLSLLDSIHLADAEVTRWGPDPDDDGDVTDTQWSEIPQPLLHRIGRPAIPEVTERILHLTSPFEGGMTPGPFACKPSSGRHGIFETGAEIDDDQIEAMERLRHDQGFDRFPPDRGGICRALVAALAKTVPDLGDPAATLRGCSPIPPGDVSAAGFLNHIFFPGETAVLLDDVWDKGRHSLLVGTTQAPSMMTLKNATFSSIRWTERYGETLGDVDRVSAILDASPLFATSYYAFHPETSTIHYE